MLAVHTKDSRGGPGGGGAEQTDRCLCWPVGDDAQGLVSGRRAMSDEDYVGMGDDLSDAQYNALYKEHFGIEL